MEIRNPTPKLKKPEKHSQVHHEQQPLKENRQRDVFFFMLLLGFIGFVIFMAIPKSWEEAVTIQEDGTYRLSEKWEKAITRKREKIKKHRLYVLVARSNGYFQCPHSPSGKFYLKTGEVYRYGTTGDAFATRGYSQKWLAVNNLILITIIEADLATVLGTQATLIGSYVILPENLRRPLPSAPDAKGYWYRLVLPPGNKSLD